MALSGGRPTINTFPEPRKKSFFQWGWRAAMLKNPCLELWNLTCVTPGSGNAHTDTWIFHCPHKACLLSAPLSVSQSENLAPLCGCTWLLGLHSEVLHLRLLKILTQKIDAAVPSSLLSGRAARSPKDRGNIERKLMWHGLREVWNKVALNWEFSLVDPMWSGPVMSLTDVSRSLFRVQAVMAAVQVFSVRGSDQGLWASLGLLFIPLAWWDESKNSSWVQEWIEISLSSF